MPRSNWVWHLFRQIRTNQLLVFRLFTGLVSEQTSQVAQKGAHKEGARSASAQRTSAIMLGRAHSTEWTESERKVSINFLMCDRVSKFQSAVSLGYSIFSYFTVFFLLIPQMVHFHLWFHFNFASIENELLNRNEKHVMKMIKLITSLFWFSLHLVEQGTPQKEVGQSTWASSTKAACKGYNGWHRNAKSGVLGTASNKQRIGFGWWRYSNWCCRRG